jgi:nucleotide-binding universal stress UspA family protein
MFKKILVAVDGSRYSNHAVDFAVDLVKQGQASVMILHVIRNLSLPEEILAMMARGEVTESRLELLQDSAEIIVDNAREKFQNAGITDIKTEYLIGSPASTIASYAEENGADLIVLGHRGISSESDEMLGGVVRKLTNISKVSCLVVK